MVKCDDNGYNSDNSSEASLPSVICRMGESDTDTSVNSRDGPDSSDGEAPAAFPSKLNHKDKGNDGSKPQIDASVGNEKVVKALPKAEKRPKRIIDDITGTENEEYELVLIKKPIELSIDDLKELNLFKLAKKAKKFSTGNGDFVSTVSETKKMLYVPCPTFVTEEDKIISPTGSITSTITVRRFLEENEEEKELDIPSIRRKPVLKLAHLKQRLKPYGLPPKKVKCEDSLKPYDVPLKRVKVEED
ncbi:unnamed protein product [Auanema sp. JU1783]|nr:unnamed protein product [Auanema sp. JU1783]